MRILADGLDSAVIAVSVGPDHGRVVYDADKCVALLVERDGMSPAEAREFLEYNTFSASVGDGSPIFVERVTPEKGRPLVEVLF